MHGPIIRRIAVGSVSASIFAAGPGEKKPVSAAQSRQSSSIATMKLSGDYDRHRHGEVMFMMSLRLQTMMNPQPPCKRGSNEVSGDKSFMAASTSRYRSLLKAFATGYGYEVLWS